MHGQFNATQKASMCLYLFYAGTINSKLQKEDGLNAVREPTAGTNSVQTGALSMSHPLIYLVTSIEGSWSANFEQICKKRKLNEEMQGKLKFALHACDQVSVFHQFCNLCCAKFWTGITIHSE